MKAAIAAAVAGLLAWTLLRTAFLQPQAPIQPKPAAAKAVECRWLKGQIEFDGIINETAWTNAQPIEFRVPWQNRQPKTATKARLLWDKEYLYFCAEMEDHDIYADIVQQNGRLWENDVFELFFKPSEKKLAYYEFQVNPNNSQLELYFPSRGSGGYNRFAPLTEVHVESVVKLNGTLNDWTDKDKGWTVEGRIPWTAFEPTGGRPKAGDVWRFALCRFDYSATLDRPEQSTSAPLTAADFHRYEDYQELVFVERK
jgi:Carbohydrate family 9 binding domain-like